MAVASQRGCAAATVTCRQYTSPYFPTVFCQSTEDTECVAGTVSRFRPTFAQES